MKSDASEYVGSKLNKLVVAVAGYSTGGSSRSSALVVVEVATDRATVAVPVRVRAAAAAIVTETVATVADGNSTTRRRRARVLATPRRASARRRAWAAPSHR